MATTEGGRPHRGPRVAAELRPRDRTRHEPEPDRQLHLGGGGPDPRHLQARQVPGRHPAPHRAPAARLRAGPHQAEGAGGPGPVQGQARQPRPPAPARLGVRLLQHVALRLREAARRRPPVAQNLRNYIAGFSPNMREVLEKFDFDNTISKLDEAGLLFQVVQRFGDPKVDLHPDAVDNAAMGTIFEELIRKFNEALNENPGEHFTPRDVVHLMVDLLLAGDRRRLRTKGVVLSVYDPCCGSGGMLTIAKEHVTAGETRAGGPCAAAVNPDADIHLFGQEVNPRDLRHLQVGPVHEVGGRPGRPERRLRQHALERPARGRRLRLHDRQPALRQGLEARPRRGGGRARPGRGGPFRAGPAPHQRRPAPVPAAHARPRPEPGRGRLAGRPCAPAR